MDPIKGKQARGQQGHACRKIGGTKECRRQIGSECNVYEVWLKHGKQGLKGMGKGRRERLKEIWEIPLHSTIKCDVKATILAREEPHVVTGPVTLWLEGSSGEMKAKLKVWGHARARKIELGANYAFGDINWDKDEQAYSKADPAKLICLKMVDGKYDQLVKRRVARPKEDEPITFAEGCCGYFCTGSRCAVQIGMKPILAMDKDEKAVFFARSSFYEELPHRIFAVADN